MKKIFLILLGAISLALTYAPQSCAMGTNSSDANPRAVSSENIARARRISELYSRCARVALHWHECINQKPYADDEYFAHKYRDPRRKPTPVPAFDRRPR